jgi:hypothetical protein
MSDLDFDQIPAQEQMVDNWGQPTPWMQALWQRLTEQIRASVGDIASAQSDLSDTQSDLAATVAGLAAAVSRQNQILTYLLASQSYQNQEISYLNHVAGLVLELLTILDDGTQPLSPPVVPSSFANFASVGAFLSNPPTPPAPP